MAYSIGFDIFANDKASATFDKFGKKVGQTESKFSKFSKAAVAGGVIAGAALVKFGADSVSAFNEAEASQRKLTDAYARFPALADESIGSLREFAAAQQNKTKFDGDEVAAAMGTLAQYKLTGKQLKELTPLMLDYAEKTGKNLPDAAKALGLATMGNAKALKEVGINIPKTADATKTLARAQDEAAKATKGVKDAQQSLADLQAVQRGKDELTIGDKIAMRKAQDNLKSALGEQTDALEFVSSAQETASKTGGKFDEIVGGLRKQVGGFAEKEGLSAEGRAAILKNKFGDLQETVGSKLQPALTRITEELIKVVDWMGKNETTVKVLGIGLGVLVAVIGTIVAITKVYTAVQTAFNVVMAMNPIGLVVVAIGLLVAGIVLIATKTTWFQTIWKVMTDALGAAWQWLWNTILAPVIRFVLGGFASITEGIAKMLDLLSNIPGFGWAKTAADKMHGAAEKARALANGIKDIPDRKDVTITINEVYTGGRSAAKGLGGSGGMVSGNAMGTDNWRGGPTWVGERGPEILNLPKGSQVIPNDRISAMADNGNSDVVSALRTLGDRFGAELERQARTIQTMQRQMA